MSTKINSNNNIVNGRVLVQPAKGSLTLKVVEVKLAVNGRNIRKQVVVEAKPDTETSLKLLVSVLAEVVVNSLLIQLKKELNFPAQLLPHTAEEAAEHGVTPEAAPQELDTVDTDVSS